MNTVTVAILAFCAAAVSAQYGSQPVVRVQSTSYSAPQQMSSYSSGGYGGQTVVRNNVPITRFSQDITGSQSNNVQYETGNGISVSDNTQAVRGSGSYNDGYGNQVRSESAIQKQGSFAYTSPEGQQISTSWVADEAGFRAQGAHLPKPVEMPAEHAEAHRQAIATASSSSNYGSYESAPAVRSTYSAPAVRVESYNAPAVRVESYNAPAVRVESYSAPAVRTQSYSAPAQILTESYSAPAQIRTESYSAPAQIRTESYSAPAQIRTESYSAPAQVVRSQSYSAPAPATVRVQSYEAPMRSSGY